MCGVCMCVRAHTRAWVSIQCMGVHPRGWTPCMGVHPRAWVSVHGCPCAWVSIHVVCVSVVCVSCVSTVCNVVSCHYDVQGCVCVVCVCVCLLQSCSTAGAGCSGAGVQIHSFKGSCHWNTHIVSNLRSVCI